MDKKISIGIIGYGDFTRVICEQLADKADIIIYSRSNPPGKRSHGASFVTIEEALSRDIIIPSIPSQVFEEFFSAHAHLINPQALILDVCSVKVKPLAVLERLLPKTCQILGTHPMFGPASVARNGGVKGLVCVVVPVRIPAERLEHIKSYLKNELQLRVITRTADKHDREMAYVQGLSHYIGRVVDIMKIPQTELATFAYKDLLDMRFVQGSDSWDLFMSIVHENPYAAEVQAKMKEAQKILDESIESRYKRY